MAQKPLFAHEGNYKAAYKHNKKWAKPGPYLTPITSIANKRKYHKWITHIKKTHGITSTKDYDYRGYWKASGHGKKYKGGHFPDKFKTPYDTTFSNESKYAKKGTPYKWRGNKLVNTKNGKVIANG